MQLPTKWIEWKHGLLTGSWYEGNPIIGTTLMEDLYMFYECRINLLVIDVSLSCFQYLSLMETIDKQREEMGRSSRWLELAFLYCLFAEKLKNKSDIFSQKLHFIPIIIKNTHVS